MCLSQKRRQPVGIMELSDFTIDETLRRKKEVLIQMYAPWCKQCNLLKPNFHAAAVEAKKAHPGVQFAAIDVAGKHGQVTKKKYAITSYPILIYFYEGDARWVVAAV